jgi:cell division septation protein DedD
LDQIQERDADDRGRSFGSILLAALALVGLTFAIGVVVGQAAEPQALPEDPLAKLDAASKSAAKAQPATTSATTAPAAPKVEAADLSFPATLGDEEERPEVLAALQAAAAEEAALAAAKPSEGAAAEAAVEAAPSEPIAIAALEPSEAEGDADGMGTEDLIATVPAAVAGGSAARSLPRAAKHDPLVAAAFRSEDDAPPAPRGHDGEFTLQVISYDRPEPSRAFAEGLRAKGHEAFVVSADIPERGRYYRVRIGPFKGRAEADAYRKKFEDDEHMNTYVVREKPE